MKNCLHPRGISPGQPHGLAWEVDKMLSYDHDLLLDGLAVTEHKAKPLGLPGGSDGKESPCNAEDPN